MHHYGVNTNFISITNCLGCVIVCVLSSSAVDCRFNKKPWTIKLVLVASLLSMKLEK